MRARSKIIAAWLVLRKTKFFIWYSIADATMRAVHFMGAQNKTSGPIFKCGVGVRYPLLERKILINRLPDHALSVEIYLTAMLFELLGHLVHAF